MDYFSGVYPHTHIHTPTHVHIHTLKLPILLLRDKAKGRSQSLYDLSGGLSLPLPLLNSTNLLADCSIVSNSAAEYKLFCILIQSHVDSFEGMVP